MFEHTFVLFGTHKTCNMGDTRPWFFPRRMGACVCPGLEVETENYGYK
jgi:hypothetical protein